MTIREACENCHILKNANPSSMAKMVSYAVLKKFKKDELVFREREDVDQFFFLVSGRIALYKTNHNQDRKVVFIYGAGEMLNEVIIQDPVASISCVALTDICVITFSRKHFLEIMENDFVLSRYIMDSLARKLRRCYRQLGNTSNAMRLDRQVASKLWKLGYDFGIEQGKFTKIDFELTITFLADMVGAKRETTSRVIKKFMEEDYIEIRKNYFYIKDMEKLRLYVTKD